MLVLFILLKGKCLNLKNYQENFYLFCKFVETVGVCKPEQLEAYLTNIDIPSNIQNSLIRTGLKNKNVAFDGTYYYSNSYVSYNQFSNALEKAIWYFVHKCSHYNFFNFSPKLPASAYFLDNSNNKTQDLTVFYIPKGTEGITTRIIETNYGGLQSLINTVIIVDDFEQVNNIILSEIFNIVDIVTVSQEGEILSYKTK